MSAFVVEDQIINDVVSFIHQSAIKTGDHYHYDVQCLVKLGYKLDSLLGCKRLAEEMFTLNCDSIEQRYGEGQASEFRPLDFIFQPVRCFDKNIYQVLKSLRCFLYQCCEGSIPEQNALYNALELLSLKISYTIVSNTKEYDTAIW